MVRFPFIPRERKFFDLFEEGIRNIVIAAQALLDLMERWENVEEKARRIVDLEHTGDDITHRIISQLHGTFVTPLDREDIAALTNSLDDIIDHIRDASDAMVIYKISHPTQRSKELTGVLVQTTLEVERAIPCLRRPSSLKNIREHCIEIHRLENEGDEVMRLAMGELFEDSEDVIEIIKWREIYEHIESAIDKCEDVANVLEGVMIKSA